MGAEQPGSYFPVRDDLAPATKGDAVRHLVVRTAFMNALFEDARFVLLRREWGERTGLLPRMRAVHDALRALGALEPLPPGTRADALPDPTLVWVPLPDAVRRAVEAVREADRALVDRLRAVGADAGLVAGMQREVTAFVRAIGTPWPWLGAELLTGFSHWVNGARVYQARYVLDRWASPGPGGASLPRGTFPDKEVAKLERDALWFYRIKVRGDSVAQVARDAFGDDPGKDPSTRRKDVREGVRRAGQLLDLGLHRF